MTTKELFSSFISLALAGIGSTIKTAHEWVNPAMILHYTMQTAQGLCYLGSFAVAILTIYKHFKDKKKNGQS